MVLTILDEEFMRIKGALLDKDRNETFELIKMFVKRLEQQSRQGLKSHLEGG